MPVSPVCAKLADSVLHAPCKCASSHRPCCKSAANGICCTAFVWMVYSALLCASRTAAMTATPGLRFQFAEFSGVGSVLALPVVLPDVLLVVLPAALPAVTCLQVGEAPDEVRAVTRQRSRWAKGHMQVFFSRRCPLIQSRLSLLHKLLYTNGEPLAHLAWCRLEGPFCAHPLG